MPQVVLPQIRPEKGDYIFFFYFEKRLDFSSNQANIQYSIVPPENIINIYGFSMFPGV